MFSQWVAGQPWWLTIMLLPALVMAAVLVRAVRYALLALAVLLALGLTVAIWRWRQRRR